ncbi:MAG: NINE protein [Oligoflexia bacterium]|nr:NINE protein [Oligoflexia bacterium]
MTKKSDSHSLLVGYLLWIFGFTGSHRFYYGRPITGTIWFCTFGLLLVGWIFDAFYMPWLEDSAEAKYRDGKFSYTIAWVLLTFFGFFGIHRFYLGKWVTGIIWLLTGGLFLVGVLFDFWTLNEQVDAAQG